MRVTIRVKPGRALPRIGGRYGDALVVAVTEPAINGRATRAAIKAVAASLGCRPRDVRLVTGATARTKIVEVPNYCAAQVRELFKETAD